MLFPAALESNVGIIARVPFEEGLLTGALRPGHHFAPGDWRADWLSDERLEEASKRVDALTQYLGADVPDLATLALKFCLSNPVVSTVIPGMRRVAHVEANLRASDGRPLPQETREALRGHAFVHGWAYPWSEVDLMTVETFANEALAEIARHRLEVEGIQATIAHENTGIGVPLGSLAVHLQVRNTEVERAMEILSKEPPAELAASEEPQES